MAGGPARRRSEVRRGYSPTPAPAPGAGAAVNESAAAPPLPERRRWAGPTTLRPGERGEQKSGQEAGVAFPERNGRSTPAGTPPATGDRATGGWPPNKPGSCGNG